MRLTCEQAEALRAIGYRFERTLQDVPRVVLDNGIGVYITLIRYPSPAFPEEDVYFWGVWHSDTGAREACGTARAPMDAHYAASRWIELNWE